LAENAKYKGTKHSAIEPTTLKVFRIIGSEALLLSRILSELMNLKIQPTQYG